MLSVQRVQFDLGGVLVDGYSANEQRPNGSIINYLSGRGLADTISCHHDTVAVKRMDRELKALLGESFTMAVGSYKMASGGLVRVDLWDTTASAKYFAFQAGKGNIQARDILIALAGTTLDIIINDAFGREYVKGQAEELVNQRLTGIIKRRTATDAAQDHYLEGHPDATKAPFYVFTNMSDALNRLLTGKPAKYWRSHFGVTTDDALRDCWGSSHLERIKNVEELAAIKIDKEGLTPVDAIKEAVLTFHYEVWELDQLIGKGDMRTYKRNKKREERAKNKSN